MKGRTALITVATRHRPRRGHRAGAQGAEVFLLCRDRGRGEETAAEIEK